MSRPLAKEGFKTDSQLRQKLERIVSRGMRSGSRRVAVNTEEAPAAKGPYSQGIIANGFLFLSGQIPVSVEGQIPTSFYEQVTQCLDNLECVARAAGGSLGDAVRLGVYLNDMENFAEMNSVLDRYFSEPRPARTTVQSNLPGFDVELDAIVLLPD